MVLFRMMHCRVCYPNLLMHPYLLLQPAYYLRKLPDKKWESQLHRIPNWKYAARFRRSNKKMRLPGFDVQNWSRERSGGTQKRVKGARFGKKTTKSAQKGLGFCRTLRAQKVHQKLMCFQAPKVSMELRGRTSQALSKNWFASNWNKLFWWVLISISYVN